MLVLPYLSSHAGCSVEIVDVADPAETRGVNTLGDIELFRTQLIPRSP